LVERESDVPAFPTRQAGVILSDRLEATKVLGDPLLRGLISDGVAQGR
jgi:hypothetical protein